MPISTLKIMQVYHFFEVMINIAAQLKSMKAECSPPTESL